MSRGRSFLLSRCCLIVTCALLPGVLPAPRASADDLFVRGDVDGQRGIDRSDVRLILRFLFRGEDAPTCFDAADADDNGELQLTDAIFLINRVYRGGSPPPAPFPWCGEDKSDDSLSCERFDSCATVAFFNHPLDEDGIVLVINRGDVRLDRYVFNGVRHQTVRVIRSLPEHVQFGVVFSDRSFERFPMEGVVDASPENKTAAIDWVEGMTEGQMSCPGSALLAAIAMDGESTATRKAILFVSHGAVLCEGAEELESMRETLEVVTEANAEAVIHTMGVTSVVGHRRAFLEDLAERNGGVYIPVNR